MKRDSPSDEQSPLFLAEEREVKVGRRRNMEFIVKKEVLDLGVKAIGAVITDLDNRTMDPAYPAWREEAVS